MVEKRQQLNSNQSVKIIQFLSLADGGAVIVGGVVGRLTGDGHSRDSDITLRVDKPDELSWNVRPTNYLN